MKSFRLPLLLLCAALGIGASSAVSFPPINRATDAGKVPVVQSSGATSWSTVGNSTLGTFTSVEFATHISNETGDGALCFANAASITGAWALSGSLTGTNGSLLYTSSTGGANGAIKGVGNGGSTYGVVGQGASGAPGCGCVGGAAAEGVQGVGGSSSRSGGVFTGGSTNGPGVTSTGTGTGAGGVLTGGSTGPGAILSGNATQSALRLTPQATPSSCTLGNIFVWDQTVDIPRYCADGTNNADIGGVRSLRLGWTAFAGGGQGSATVICVDAGNFSTVTTVASPGDSVKLPANFVAGGVCKGKNLGANSMNLFPNTGDNLCFHGDGACVGVNTAKAIAVHEQFTCIARAADASNWDCSKP